MRASITTISTLLSLLVTSLDNVKKCNKFVIVKNYTFNMVHMNH